MAKPGSAIAPVVKTITVKCTPEEAFRYFTEAIGKWWPLATHSCVAFASEFKDHPVSVMFERRIGGRIFERERSGKEHEWGTVASWNPPKQVTFTWYPGRDQSTAQQVEVAFSAVEGGTRVVLTHSGFENVEDGEAERKGYNEGWEGVFVSAFFEYVQKQK
jgi:Activator of Hsp90 ATPase homolog 1-like protein